MLQKEEHERNEQLKNVSTSKLKAVSYYWPYSASGFVAGGEV
jgi:hypothetical protein